MASFISVQNYPAMYGIRFAREPAKIRAALLYDLESKEVVGPPLSWRGLDDSQFISIEPGQVANLYVFGKEREASDYFVYSRKTNTVGTITPPIRYQARKKDFAVIIIDQIGRRYRFAITVKHSAQSVAVHPKLTWSARWRMLREGLRQMAQAFKPSV